MKILLFGSTGLLGSHLLREFERRQWPICAPRRTDIDLFDLSQVNNFVGHWLSRDDSHVVVYAAGHTDITKCHHEPGTAEHLNVIAPLLLANLCTRVGARFVYYSTDQVFMDRLSTGFYTHHENDDLDGDYKTEQTYGRTKADAESFIRRYANHLIIRTSWLFGSHPTRSNFVRDVVQRGRQRETIIGLRDYTACPSYAPDVASATADVLSNPSQLGTFHLVNGPAISRYLMAKTILDYAGLEANLESLAQADMGPTWIPRNPNGGLNNTRGPQLRPWTAALSTYLEQLDRTTDQPLTR